MADVLAGRIVTSKFVRLAIERQMRDLEHGPARGLRFDRDAAQRPIKFFGFLRHSKGQWAGEPFALEPWQQCLLWILFGWKRADGTRRFREALVEIARKNGKSTLAAGIGLYMLVADGEPGAEIYAGATTKDQIKKSVFSEAQRMVASSPGLRERIENYKESLFLPGTASKFEPIAANHEKQDGYNPHAGIMDEVHAMPNGELWDVLDTGMGARRQPLMFGISTAGADQTSFFGQKRTQAIDILTGAIDQFDAIFVMIYELDDGDDVADESCWIKANPNLDVSVKREYLRDQVEKAQKFPSARNGILRKNFDVWTQSAEAWIPMDGWQVCGELPWSLDALLGQPCYGGLDLSSTIDLSAFVLVFRVGLLRALWCKFWMPQANLVDREREDRFQYTRLVNEQVITATPGKRIDYDRIRAEINVAAKQFAIQEIAYDPHNATQLVTQLTGDGHTMVEMRQGFLSLSAPSKEFERLIVEHRLAHGRNEVLTWMAAGTSTEDDPAGNIKPSKLKSTRRIDGIIAAVMAIGRDMLRPEVTSVYETRGVISLG